MTNDIRRNHKQESGGLDSQATPYVMVSKHDMPCHDHGSCALVSVIIPTRNRSTLLERAILSVINQDYSPIEILVIDDNSDDPQKNISAIKQIDPSLKSVKYFSNTQSMGGAWSRNFGVDQSSGAYIAFLDDDDEYQPNKISSLVGYLNSPQGSTADGAFGKIRIISGIESFYPVRYPKRFIRTLNLLVLNTVHTNASLIKRSTFLKTRFLASLPRFQDLQYYVEFSMYHEMHFVDIDAAKWYVDANRPQITSDTQESRLRTYHAFSHMLDYFEDNLQLPKAFLANYYVAWIRYAIRAKQHLSILNAKGLARSSIAVLLGLPSMAVKKYVLTKNRT